MTDSILTSIKKLLGIEEDYTQFDQDVIMHINTVLGILRQLGLGPDQGFFITDKSYEWTDLLSDRQTLEMVKTYMYLKVRLMFDPPQSTTTMQAIQEQIKELEFRISVTVDPGEPKPSCEC